VLDKHLGGIVPLSPDDTAKLTLSRKLTFQLTKADQHLCLNPYTIAAIFIRRRVFIKTNTRTLPCCAFHDDLVHSGSLLVFSKHLKAGDVRTVAVENFR
jgi:hypothetical protein